MASKPKVATVPLKDYNLFVRKLEKELCSLEENIHNALTALDDLYSAKQKLEEEGK